MRRVLMIAAVLLGAAALVFGGPPRVYGQGLSPSFKMRICSPGSAADDIAREEAEHGRERAEELFKSYEMQLVCISIDELLLDKNGAPRIIASEKALIFIYPFKMWNERWEGLKVLYLSTKSRAA